MGDLLHDWRGRGVTLRNPAVWCEWIRTATYLLEPLLATGFVQEQGTKARDLEQLLFCPLLGLLTASQSLHVNFTSDTARFLLLSLCGLRRRDALR